MEADTVPKNTSSPAPDVDLLPKYTIPGILHFIQHEWTRFEMDRAHWEVERAELQVMFASFQINTDLEDMDTSKFTLFEHVCLATVVHET